MDSKGLFEALGGMRKDWPPEKFAEALVLRLQALDESFASRALEPIEASLKTERTMIRQLGAEIDAQSGLPGMQAVYALVKESGGGRLADNLSYCWEGVGDWRH